MRRRHLFRDLAEYAQIRPRRTLLASIVAPCVVAGIALAAAAATDGEAWRKDFDPEDAKLDFCQLRYTFKEDFNDLSVAATKIGDKRWIAHTPWNGDFGDAAFADPTPGFPFTVKDGILSISARKGPEGKWRSGLLASADGEAKGFAQTYGYFETRAKLPEGPGVWPAFWLNTALPADNDETSVEFDVFEYYGVSSSVFHTVVHVWKKNPLRDNPQSTRTQVPPGSLSDKFNTYGMKVTPKTTTFYLNREPYWQIKTPEEHKKPLLLLINLAAGSGFPIDKMHDPSVMQVDYVHAYEFAPSKNILCIL